MAILDSNALTTINRLEKEFTIDTSDNQETDFVKELIMEASLEFKNKTGRSFFYTSDTTERVPGSGNKRLQVWDHIPIDSIDNIKFQESVDSDRTIDSGHYYVEDADKGWITQDHGSWIDTESFAWDINPRRKGERIGLYKVTYSGGYKNRYQEENDASVDEVTLPQDIERAIIGRVTQRFIQAGKDPSVKRERVLGASVTYEFASEQGPDFFDQVVNRYRRWI